MSILIGSLLKIQARGIYAVTQACWRGAIFKHMAKMAAAIAAINFNAGHAVRVIHLLRNCTINSLKIAWPARATLKLCCAFKQILPASYAAINPCFVMFIIFAAKWRLSAAAHANCALLWA